MFQFGRLAHYCSRSSIGKVSPFGNLRIKSYLLIPAAYRSLSRPSSPLRAKASPVYPFLLSSTHTPFAPYGMSFFLSIKFQVLSLKSYDFPTSDFRLNVSICCFLLFSITSSNMSKNVLLSLKLNA